VLVKLAWLTVTSYKPKVIGIQYDLAYHEGGRVPRTATVALSIFMTRAHSVIFVLDSFVITKPNPKNLHFFLPLNSLSHQAYNKTRSSVEFNKLFWQ